MRCLKGDLGQIQNGEDIGITQLIREGDTDEVKISQRSSRLQAGKWYGMITQIILGIGSGAIASFGVDIGQFVEQMIEDMQALVGHPDFIQIRKDKGTEQITVRGRGVSAIYLMAQIAPGLGDM